jgi:non-ribosomal peptide synthetase component F
LFSTLTAAFVAVLADVGGSADAGGSGTTVVMTPVANRAPGAGNLVGRFADALPLRIDAGDDPTFAVLVRRVRDSFLEAQEHYVPVAEVMRALGLEPAGEPPFRVRVEFEREERFALALPGVAASVVELDFDASPADLLLRLTDLPDGIACHLEYATDLFGDAVAEEMLRSFEEVGRAAVSDADRPLSSLRPGRAGGATGPFAEVR